jgi:Zn-finger nucleic acid-binding protein
MKSACCKKMMTVGEGRRVSWRCPGCTAVAVNASVLKETLGEGVFNPLWQTLRAGAESGVGCPECGISMNHTYLDDVHLEGCAICTLVWFDAGEWEQMLGVELGESDPTRKLTPEEMQQVISQWRRQRAENEETEDATLWERLLAAPSPRAQLLGVWLTG